MNSPRAEAIRAAREILSTDPVYLDTETTGIDVKSEIIEISIVDDRGEVLLDTLVKPTQRIPLDATRIHNITNIDVASASTWMQIWPTVEGLLANRMVGIYNADFDVRLMKQSHIRHVQLWPAPPLFTPFCIMKLYARFRGEWNSGRGTYRWISLEAAGSQCRISLPNAHRALADTLLTRALLHYMAEAG